MKSSRLFLKSNTSLELFFFPYEPPGVTQLDRQSNIIQDVLKNNSQVIELRKQQAISSSIAMQIEEESVSSERLNVAISIADTRAEIQRYVAQGYLFFYCHQGSFIV